MIRTFAKAAEHRFHYRGAPATLSTRRDAAAVEKYVGGNPRVARAEAQRMRGVHYDFSRIAVHSQRPASDGRGQNIIQASDQKMSVTDFAESFNGIHIKAAPSNVEFPDPWVAPNGFRWLQTIITNTPLAGKPAEAVDPGTYAEPFYYDQPPSQKEPGEFEDYPNRGVPSAGQTVAWDATLTLVGLDRNKRYLTPYDVRSYGFRATLMSGTSGVSDVKLVAPKQDWSALGKQRTIVKARYPAWELSLLKGR